MTLMETIESLKLNEARYASEIKTGLYADGNPVPLKMIEKRKESLARVRRFIVIAERWSRFAPRPDAFLTADERELIANYELGDSLFAQIA